MSCHVFAFPWPHQIVALQPSFTSQSLFLRQQALLLSNSLLSCSYLSLFLLKIHTAAINAAPKVNLKQTSLAQSKCISIFSSKHFSCAAAEPFLKSCTFKEVFTEPLSQKVLKGCCLQLSVVKLLILKLIAGGRAQGHLHGYIGFFSS